MCSRARSSWDLGTLTFIRRLEHKFKDEKGASTGHAQAASSVSINHKNGNIVTLVGPHLSVFDVNGRLLGTENSLGARPTCAVATDCPEWQQDGIVAVTGHVNGEVRFWSLNYDTGELCVRELMVDVEHRCEITSLHVTGDNQNTLLVGDVSGKMSICRTVQLENMPAKEFAEIALELRGGQSKFAQQQGSNDQSSDIPAAMSVGIESSVQHGLEVVEEIPTAAEDSLPDETGDAEE